MTSVMLYLENVLSGHPTSSKTSSSSITILPTDASCHDGEGERARFLVMMVPSDALLICCFHYFDVDLAMVGGLAPSGRHDCFGGVLGGLFCLF